MSKDEMITQFVNMSSRYFLHNVVALQETEILSQENVVEIQYLVKYNINIAYI